VPVSGAWAQCPRCQERFFINPAGSSLEDLTRPIGDEGPGSSPSRAGRATPRDSSSQRLLERLKAKRGLPEELPYEPSLIIVYPEPAVPDSVYKAVSVLMLCLPLVAVIWLFSSTNTRLNRGPETPPASAATIVEQLNERDSPERIRTDLLAIKRDHMIRRRGFYGVGFSGPESRVFNYFMTRLAPGVCDGVRYLQINAPQSGAAGFTVTGLCLAPEGRRLVMRVDWVGRGRSRISFPYNRSSEDFLLLLDAAGTAGAPNSRVTRPGA